MLIGPKYKRARYLGVPIFKKTETQKYSIRAQRKSKGKSGGPKGKSEYGKQMMEKQKARYAYGVNNTQFSNYVKKALAMPGDNYKDLIRLLEGRLDNVVYRGGFIDSRTGARQLVSHGHITVNGKILNVPSYEVRVGDKISIREGSKKKAIFNTLDERLKTVTLPAWLKVDPAAKIITIDGEPMVAPTELLFDVKAVLEFYTR
jgi:small subunit ribosomal protein S4